MPSGGGYVGDILHFNAGISGTYDMSGN